MEPIETAEVETAKVACDGNGPTLGHPRVFLTIGQEGSIDCPYCGKRFILKAGAKVAGGGH